MTHFCFANLTADYIPLRSTYTCTRINAYIQNATIRQTKMSVQFTKASLPKLEASDTNSYGTSKLDTCFRPIISHDRLGGVVVRASD